MKIRLLVVGHLKEQYWKDAQNEYIKRLQPYAKVELEEVDDLPSSKNASEAEIEEVKTKENAKILSKIKPNEFVVLLDLGKEQHDSVQLSKDLDKWMRDGGSNVTFVIGGSLGLTDEMRRRGNATLTLSKLTFTHQMVRVILLEQIYRSFKILHNEPYHK
ncbi:MAG: 23S rRNA (pseudouridine(1915)-N(3))-methyltransferase RlmH [Bacilli bacterium]|nr:23S rRNA (pseudouridine(1915)-N(3))-methyltransferase RlmH [Bacilli bacterium]